MPSYTFTIEARDAIGGISKSAQTFTLNVVQPYNKAYCDFYVPIQFPIENRVVWNNFIYNENIFNPTYIWRGFSGSGFGIPSDIKILIHSGVEYTTTEQYSTIFKNVPSTKRFLFGDIKTAIAHESNTRLYEVVYVEIIDAFIEPTVVESYSNSIIGWRQLLKASSLSFVERDYLPAWMKTVQPDTNREIGYIPCIVLAYCKPYTSSKILSNIQVYMDKEQFMFNQFNPMADRFMILPPHQSCPGVVSKYLRFGQ